uniref:Uncharacterized protein n=1 Tax=Acrobeloides nanus TaxID=290746 RepID=A0A914BWB0_9BILA
MDQCPSSPYPNSPRSVSRLPQYGNPSASNHHPSNRNMHTQLWMQNHYFDGNYPSPSPSVAPSVMSNLSCLSIPDDVSMLSVNTQMSGVSQFIDRRFIHTPNGQPSSASSCVENVDPNEKNEVNCQLDEMLNAISDAEMQVRDKAINVIRMYFQRYNNRNLNRTKLKKLIDAIVRLINEFLPDVQKYRQLRELVECLYNFSTPTWIDVLRELLIEQGEHGPLSSTLCRLFEQSEERINLLVIHIIRTLLSDTRYMASVNVVKRTARQNAFLSKLLERIRNLLNNFEHAIFYVDVLRVLIKGSNAHKQFVIENDGMRLLLKHMTPRPNQHPAIEKLKYSVLRAIYSLISSEKRRFSEHFVECEGIDILARELSSRYSANIIRLTLEIFCCVSDAEKLKSRKLDDPLKMVLLELGRKVDSVSTKAATGFICNLAGSNLHAKEFLTNDGAIPILLDLIKQCLTALHCTQPPTTAEKRADASEILENCLIALVNLSSQSNSARASAFKTLAMQPLNRETLFMIAGISQYGGKDNQRRILTLLQRMCSFDMKLLDEMKCYDDLPKCLFHCIWSNALMCNEEKTQREREIVEKSFNILTMLLTRNASYAEYIISIAKKDYNLFSLLNVVNHVETCILILSFIDLMCKDERFRLYYGADAEALNIIERCSRSTASGLEAIGVSLLKKFRLESDVRLCTHISWSSYGI